MAHIELTPEQQSNIDRAILLAKAISAIIDVVNANYGLTPEEVIDTIAAMARRKAGLPYGDAYDTVEGINQQERNAGA